MCFTAAENSATPAETPLMVSDLIFPFTSSRRPLQAAFQPGRSLVLGAFVLGGSSSQTIQMPRSGVWL